MAKEIQSLRITEQITVGAFKVEVGKGLKAEVVKFDNGEIKVKYTNEVMAGYVTPPVPKEYAKIVWQKAQQQQP